MGSTAFTLTSQVPGGWAHSHTHWLTCRKQVVAAWCADLGPSGGGAPAWHLQDQGVQSALWAPEPSVKCPGSFLSSCGDIERGLWTTLRAPVRAAGKRGLFPLDLTQNRDWELNSSLSHCFPYSVSAGRPLSAQNGLFCYFKSVCALN